MTEGADEAQKGVVGDIKDLLSAAEHRIALDDFVSQRCTAARAELEQERFSTSERAFNADALQRRLDGYNDVTAELLAAGVLIARWGEPMHLPTLQRVLRTSADHASSNDGVVQWIGLRWMPSLMLLYGAGIAALAGERWETLVTLYRTGRARRRSDDSPILTQQAVEGMAQVGHDPFRMLPAYERRRVALSDYLYDCLRPVMADLIHVSGEYDDLFDRFEIIHAVAYVHARYGRAGNEQASVWGPVGRFAVKYHDGGIGNPYKEMEEEVKTVGPAWPLAKAGFFGGSHEEFLRLAERFREGMLNRLNWY